MGVQQYLYGPAIVELRLSDLHLLGVWKVPTSQQARDSDFGSTPTLFTASIGGVKRRMVGAVNKNGVYYAFERNKVSAGPVWQTHPKKLTQDTIASSPWDGKHLYLASHNTFVHGAACTGKYGSLQAMDPATGAFVWEDCLYGGEYGGPAFSPVTAAPGMVLAAIGSHIYVLNPDNGHELFSYQNVDFNWYYSPLIMSHGVLFAPNSDGRLYTFTIDGR
jgi:outer membrane protein assembly factor BamB